MNRKVSLAVLALSGVLSLAACSQDNGTKPIPPITVGTGSLSIVKPDAVTATVTNSTGGSVASGSYGTLSPGNYSVTFSRPGYVSQTTNTTVVANQNTTVTAPELSAVTAPTKGRGVYYVNAAGNLVAVPVADLSNPDKFVFQAWLENEDAGIAIAENKISGAATDSERIEVAPSRTQNLAAGYVGYISADGTVFPVAGATVRWNITGAAPARASDVGGSNTNVIFGGADDGSNDTNFGGGITPQNLKGQSISAAGKQADTITNTTSLANTPFPSSTAQYPLNNATGVTSPNVNGFTWTTLFSTSDRASAEIVAVASVGDLEVGKQVLNKYFAPRPNVTITKTVLTDSTAPTTDGQAAVGGTVTMRIAVTNNGAGVANAVNVTDRLVSGDPALTSITQPAPQAGVTYTAQGDDGFDATIAALAPGQTINIDFPVTSNTAGVYCDQATLTNFDSLDFDIVNSGLQKNACAIFVAPNVNVIKTFLDAAGNDLGASTQVSANVPASVRFRVVNNGGADASITSVDDNLVRVNNAAVTTADPSYSTTLPTGAVANARDGFTYTAPFTLAPGASRDFTFAVQSSADGTYCDAGSVASNGGNPTSNEACLTVATPKLTITKVNSSATVQPGSNYTSTITVRNTGTGTAQNVNVSDLLAQNGPTNVSYASATFQNGANAASAAFFNPTNRTAYASANGTDTINIPAGGSVLLTVTSTVPAAATPGSYCDFASFTSANAGTGTASACVQVRQFVALQTQLSDTLDPVVGNGGTTADGRTNYTSLLVNEASSNEAVNNSTVTYAFGAATLNGTDGLFSNPTTTDVYIDATPQRDANTGAVISDNTNASAVKLVLGTDYTIGNNANGEQTLSITRTLNPGGVFFVRHLGVSASVAPKQYFTNYVWSTTGVVSNTIYQGASSEPTTIK